MRKAVSFSLLPAIVAALAMTLTACSTTPDKTTTATPVAEAKETTLYSRLGGQAGISGVVDELVTNVSKDKRIRRYFAHTDIPSFKSKLVEQICSATGGPCTYTGRDMKTVHAKMHIKKAQFNALVEDLIKAMNKRGVPEKEQKELLAILGPMQKDIVTR